MKGNFSRRAVYFSLTVIAVCSITLVAYSTDIEKAYVNLSDDVVKILKPKGSFGEATHPDGSFNSDKPPYRYDFQGVAPKTPGPYPFDIKGFVRSPFMARWIFMDSSAGMLVYNDVKEFHPTLPMLGQVVLTLRAIDPDGTDTGYTDERHLYIYEDHLARDIQNFQYRYPPIDDSTSFIMQGASGPIGFNCHRSTMHAFNGTNPPWPEDGDKWDFEKWSPLFWGNTTSIPTPQLVPCGTPLPSLNRGDVIAYYNNQNGGLRHSQTVVDSNNTTWGANNDPEHPEGAPYRYEFSRAGEYCGNQQGIYIQIFKKPLNP